MILYRYLNKPRSLDDLLVRVTNIEGREREQFVVSSEVVSAILEFLHNRIGHPGRENTTAFVMHRFYWPGMRKDIANWVDQQTPATTGVFNEKIPLKHSNNHHR